jgi:protoporphyrinogen/coproporphyrinogen III oxidase
MAHRVAVVGGGIAGLAAAYRLRRELGPDAEIVLVEQGDRLGGKLRTVELAGCRYDVGAEAFLNRRPEARQLAEELGIPEDAIVYPNAASATVRAGGQTRRLPGGVVMGVPASAEAVQDVLSPAGVAAVRAEADLPPLRLGGADVSVGELLRGRVGDEVVDRLVEPLLGGVYAGDANLLGLRATIPALAAALDAGAESITSAAAAALPAPNPAAPKTPVFGAFRHGYRELIDRLLIAADVKARLGLPVRQLARTASGWRLEIGAAPSPEFLDVDAVVLAVPAAAARRLLADAVPVAAAKLGEVELSSSIVVGLALPPDAQLPDVSGVRPSGVLIARGERHADGTPFTAKAFTYSSNKWSHLRGVNGELLVRGSVGRFGETAELQLDDAEVLRRVRADFAELTGITADPVDSVVVRWGGGLPQYGVGHLDLVADVERAVAEVPGLAIAGAVLHGVGVPACIATGMAAATDVTRDLLQADRREVGR